MQKLGQKRSHELPSDFLGQPCRKLVREGWGLLPVRVARLSRKEIRIKPLKFLTSHAECGQAQMAPLRYAGEIEARINEHIVYLEARYAADGEAKESIKLGVATVRPSVVSSGSQNPRSELREPH